jgi:hypothetical protein
MESITLIEGSMHYERSALLGEYGAGMLDKNQREDRQIG